MGKLENKREDFRVDLIIKQKTTNERKFKHI